MTDISLNQGQQAAANGFFNYLFSNETELCISGPGGVGKTFLMGHLIDKVLPRYHESCKLLGINPLYHSVDMTATTNKAAEVLGKATGRPTSTAHSFLSLRVDEDYKTGKTRLARTRDWSVHNGKILFVDEASMIDSQLLKEIREGTRQCKIVYVGDHCQLAPVNETLSPIYKANLPFYELTQPMRNAEQPALVEVCTQLRQTVQTGIFRPIRTVPGVIDHLDPDEMEQEVYLHFMDPDNQDRILGYQNVKVVAVNNYIRQMRGLPPVLTVGERVVNNAAMTYNNEMLRVEDEFEVTEVNGEVEKAEIVSGVFITVVRCTLRGRHATFRNIPVPTDREHVTQLMKYYAQKKDWKPYFQLKNNYPDLRPRDAATVHKAQGSTYDTVFIDLDDLSTCFNADTAARLLYVAFSRARRRVVLFGKLAPKYGGIIK